MVTGNALYKAINKHYFNWKVVPNNLEGGEKRNLIWKCACNPHMHKSILKQACIMDNNVIQTPQSNL